MPVDGGELCFVCSSKTNKRIQLLTPRGRCYICDKCSQEILESESREETETEETEIIYV